MRDKKCLVCGKPEGPVVIGFCSFECFFELEESLEEEAIEIRMEEVEEVIA